MSGTEELGRCLTRPRYWFALFWLLVGGLLCCGIINIIAG
jgi:hypothetical protein